MSLPELDNLVRAKSLKSEPGSQKEFDGLIESGRVRLADSKTASLSIDGRFSLAYDAAHAFSLAALRWHGYRPENRYVVFQTLQHTLGIEPKLWRVLNEAHRFRNSAEYQGRFEVDERFVAELQTITEIVKSAVRKLGPVK